VIFLKDTAFYLIFQTNWKINQKSKKSIDRKKFSGDNGVVMKIISMILSVLLFSATIYGSDRLLNDERRVSETNLTALRLELESLLQKCEKAGVLVIRSLVRMQVVSNGNGEVWLRNYGLNWRGMESSLLNLCVRIREALEGDSGALRQEMESLRRDYRELEASFRRWRNESVVVFWQMVRTLREECPSRPWSSFACSIDCQKSKIMRYLRQDIHDRLHQILFDMLSVFSLLGDSSAIQRCSKAIVLCEEVRGKVLAASEVGSEVSHQDVESWRRDLKLVDARIMRLYNMTDIWSIGGVSRLNAIDLLKAREKTKILLQLSDMIVAASNNASAASRLMWADCVEDYAVLFDLTKEMVQEFGAKIQGGFWGFCAKIGDCAKSRMMLVLSRF
jgi:hypothetical protein